MDIGKRDYRELERRLRLIIMHLLKTAVAAFSVFGLAEVDHQIPAREVAGISPSLRLRIIDALRHDSRKHGRTRSNETGITPDSFPAGCAYSVDQLIDPEYWP
jgi:hypothetical protein